MTVAMTAVLWLAIATAGGAHAAPVTIAIDDRSAFHVHPPGKPFTLGVRINLPKQSALQYQWRDYRGQVLTDFTPIGSGHSTLSSPRAVPGYYGLVFRAASGVRLPDRELGEEREYGFVIAPARAQSKLTEAAAHFGLVHAELGDPCVPAWVKTATWQTYGPTTWAAEMRRRRAAGATELPLVMGAEWEQDDSRAIGGADLTALEARLRHYFAADPKTRYWELGLEENLDARYRQPFYWSNLAAKATAARRGAAADVRFIYQIAELDIAPVQRFLSSAAAARFDVLALHPYAWPDFPAPERWLGKYLQSVRDVMRKTGTDIPIWFTEVGAPQHGNAAGQFFGYPESNRAVNGLSPAQVARYLIKLHVLALHDGVEKIFWYNYRDRHAARDQAEQHFGLRDFWGFSKPAYAAWCHMQRTLAKGRPTAARETHDGLWIRGFDNKRERVWVLWTYPETSRHIALDVLDARLTNRDVIALRDSVGTPLALDDERIPVGADPVYLVTRIKDHGSRAR